MLNIIVKNGFIVLLAIFLTNCDNPCMESNKKNISVYQKSSMPKFMIINEVTKFFYR